MKGSEGSAKTPPDGDAPTVGPLALGLWVGLTVGVAELTLLGLMEFVLDRSDHGEEFGEHDMLGHGDRLFAPLIRVPLVLAMPGRAPAGLTIHEPVSLRNLPRTVLDLVEIGDASRFPGFPLSRLWEDPPPATRDSVRIPEPVYSFEEGLVSIVLGPYHYIVDDEENEQLFDIVGDPLEQADLAGSRDLLGTLERFRALRPDAASGPSGLSAR